MDNGDTKVPRTQKEQLLDLLLDNQGHWVPLPEIITPSLRV